MQYNQQEWIEQQLTGEPRRPWKISTWVGRVKEIEVTLVESEEDEIFYREKYDGTQERREDEWIALNGG
jgi:hypothetical protein